MAWRRIRPYRPREGVQDDEPTKKDDPARESKGGVALSKDRSEQQVEGPTPSAHSRPQYGDSGESCSPPRGACCRFFSKTLNFRPAGRGRFWNLPRPAPSAFSPSIPKHALHSAPTQGDAIGRSRVSLASRSTLSCINRAPSCNFSPAPFAGLQCRGRRRCDERSKSQKGKAGRLGERPAFLLSPPGCGVIEALGCVGRGFDERPGEPPAG